MLTKAREHLAAARYLFQGGHFRDSISRSYYAAYSAMWFYVGDPPRGQWDHGGLRKQFAFLLHSRGMPPAECRTYNRDASELYALRRASDYFRSPVDEQEANWALRKAEAIVGYGEAL